MSVLPAQVLRRLCQEGWMHQDEIGSVPEKKCLVHPFEERGVAHGKTHGLGPCTYDFRIRERVVLWPAYFIAFEWFFRAVDRVRGWVGLDPKWADHKVGFTLASTLEEVCLPAHIEAMVMDKSSWARKGLAVQNTHFDPGFTGYPTLEISNHSMKTVEIPAGVAVCQFKFSYLSEATESPYRGRYQNQPPRPVEAKEGASTWG